MISSNIIKTYCSFLIVSETQPINTSFEAVLVKKHQTNVDLTLNYFKTLHELTVVDDPDGLQFIKKNVNLAYDDILIFLQLTLNENRVRNGKIPRNYLQTLTRENILYCVPDTISTTMYAKILESKTITDLQKNIEYSFKTHLFDILPKRAPQIIVSKIKNLLTWLQAMYANREVFHNVIAEPYTSLNNTLSSISRVFDEVKATLKFSLEQTELTQKEIERLEVFIANIYNLEKTILYILTSINDSRIKFEPMPPIIDGIRHVKPEEEQKELNFPPQPLSVTTHKASFLLKQENTDLQKFPEKMASQFTENDVLAFGDLHGNFIKLIYFLYFENIISGLDSYIYFNFYNLAINPINTSSQIELFRQSLANVSSAQEKSPMIIYIGDFMADRRTNVFFVLLILKRKDELSIPQVILLSNHDNELIGLYENGELFEPETVEGRPFYKTNIDCDTSLQALGLLLINNLVEPSVLRKLIEEHYLPHLVALEYSVDEENKEFNFYTHAPVGLNIIHEIAAEEKLTIDETMPLTPQIIGNNINIINAYVRELLRARKFYQNAVPGSALYALLWHRIEKDKPANEQRLQDNIPGWKINYIHGHDGEGIAQNLGAQKTDINLDNILGKYEPENNQELITDYTAYYSGNNKTFLEAREPLPVPFSLPSVPFTMFARNSTSITSAQFTRSLSADDSPAASTQTPNEPESQGLKSLSAPTP
jgi:hypothetical protein